MFLDIKHTKYQRKFEHSILHSNKFIAPFHELYDPVTKYELSLKLKDYRTPPPPPVTEILVKTPQLE